MNQSFLLPPDKKHPLRCAVYDRYIRRNPLQTKLQTYEAIAKEFNISVSTVQRYIEKMQSGKFTDSAKKQGRYVYAWDDEALSFFTNFYLAALSEVGSCTVRNAYNCTKAEAQRRGWNIGSEQSAYVHARNISPAMKMLAKGGQRALDNMFYISRDLSKLRPFQLIVGDQHRFDFWCLSPDGKEYIRPECYLWLDMATRIVYGVSFDPHYNTRTVVRALRMGIQRFGKFDSTYNDNGSSEKSELADYIVANLQSYGVRFIDEADLYHAENNRYIVEDTEGCIVDVVKTKADWEKQHRRIFAKVKNAKTKPIERFFNTLEQVLRDLCLPGYVKEVGMSAPEEEQASARLKWQRKHGYVLTYDEFIQKVLQAIDIYEKREHATLKCSPQQRLNEYVKNGWQPTFIDKRDESYLFMERTFATVKGDRVQLGKTEYIGPDLTQQMILENRGTLVAYNRQKVELRYDPENLDLGVFALEPCTNNVIPLHPVTKIDMLDSDAVAEQMAWKKRNIKAVVQAFNEATKNKNLRVLSDPSQFAEYRKAQSLVDQALQSEDQLQIEAPKKDSLLEQIQSVTKVGEKVSISNNSKSDFAELPKAAKKKSSDFSYVPVALKRTEDELTDDEFINGLASRIGNENILRAHGKKVFLTERERYQDILSATLQGERISREDVDFKFKYEAKMLPAEEQYWQTFCNQNRRS